MPGHDPTAKPDSVENLKEYTELFDSDVSDPTQNGLMPSTDRATKPHSVREDDPDFVPESIPMEEAGPPTLSYNLRSAKRKRDSEGEGHRDKILGAFVAVFDEDELCYDYAPGWVRGIYVVR